MRLLPVLFLGTIFERSATPEITSSYRPLNHPILNGDDRSGPILLHILAVNESGTADYDLAALRDAGIEKLLDHPHRSKHMMQMLD